MKAIIQRVSEASVCVNGTVIGQIGKGFLILLGIREEDTDSDADILSQKIADLRIFTDGDDKMNLSLKDVGGSALVISNFTLCADTKKGNRPSFSTAKQPDEAKQMYLYFIEKLKSGMIPVETGEFGADMKVRLLNDGPVTIPLDTALWRK